MTAPTSGYYVKHEANFDKIVLVLMHQGKSFHGRHHGASKLQKTPLCYYTGQGGHRLWGSIGRLGSWFGLDGVGQENPQIELRRLALDGDGEG